MWKNTVERDRPQMTIWRMRFVYWITKATNVHSQYVILIAFPLQHRLQERSSMWRLNVHCLSCFTTAQQSLVGQDPLIIEASRSHSDTPHSVGLLWTSDQPNAETCIWQHTKLTIDRHPCSHGIRTRTPRKRAAAYPRLRSRGHRDWHLTQLAKGNDPWKKYPRLLSSMTLTLAVVSPVEDRRLCPVTDGVHL